MPDEIDQLWPAAADQFSAGDFPTAEAMCRRILQLQPRHSEAMQILGLIARQTGRPDVAAELIRRAISFDPNAANLRINLGIVLDDLGRIPEAIESLRAGLALDPNSFAGWSNLAESLRQLSRLEDSVACSSKAIELRPDFTAAMHNLAVALTEQGRVRDAIAHTRRALEIAPDFTAARDTLLLNLHYVDDVTPREIFEEHRFGAQSLVAKRSRRRRATRGVAAIGKDPRLLRVGYVSPDFRRHPVAFFIEPVFEHYDRERFEVFAYSANTQADEITSQLSRHVNHWRDITTLDAARAAQMIRDDRVDILIDLAGHMGGNRLDVFALKPAAVQITYLGYPDTTGVVGIDFRITDKLADPPGTSDRYCTEQLIRLPKTFLCYRPGMTPEIVPRDPKDGALTFASFNHLPKVSGSTIDVWAQILKSVPESSLLLKSAALGEPPTQQRVHDEFSKLGIEPQRIDLLGNVPSHYNHLELYRRVDIALDTFPYNGTTTTCEALWMGVPVVTLKGKTHAGRVGASLLSGVGLKEFVATSVDDYVKIAVLLSRDLNKLSELRGTLRDRMSASPLMDEAHFVRDLEDAYLRARESISS